jgi:hypothetical protein
MSRAERIANKLGGAKKVGNQWLCRCPCHDDRHASLSIVDTTDGDVLWNCFANCDGGDISCELYRRGLLPYLGKGGKRQLRPLQRRPTAAVAPDRSTLNWLLTKLRPIEGKTPVETYLGTRDLDLPPDGHHLHYLPEDPPKFVWPCMVGIVTLFADPERILSLHFTRLRPDGMGKAPLPKNEQRSYLAGFPKKGGVIRLCADADVTLRLGVAEGIETACSVSTSFRRAGWDQPVWAALDAGNMAALPHLRGVDQLFIYADRGPAGEQGADELAQRWLEAGTEVLVSSPPVDDWNLAVESSA